jgi:hypothetical protein
VLPGPTPSLESRTEPCASLGPRQAGYDATPQWALPARTWPTGPQRSAGDLRSIRFRPRHQQHRRLPSLPLHQRAAERSLWMAAPDESKHLEVALNGDSLRGCAKTQVALRGRLPRQPPSFISRIRGCRLLPRMA